MRGKSVKRNEKNKSASVLFCDLTNEWLELVKEKTKPSTYSKYRRDCEKFILPALGDLRLTDGAQFSRFYACFGEEQYSRFCQINVAGRGI